MNNLKAFPSLNLNQKDHSHQKRFQNKAINQKNLLVKQTKFNPFPINKLHKNNPLSTE